MNGDECDLSVSSAGVDCDVDQLAQQVQQTLQFDDGDPKEVRNDSDDGNTDACMAFDFGDLAAKYGENQRGLLAKRDLCVGDVILNEDAMVYTSDIVYETYGEEEEEEGKDAKAQDPYFMTRSIIINNDGGGSRRQVPVDVIPEDMARMPGGWYIALACLLIQQREDVADLTIGDSDDPSLALFGRHNPNKSLPTNMAYKNALTHYAQVWGADKLARWTEERFTKLYCVMQTNALLHYLPMTHCVYAAGFFPGSAFVNHSCMPNAIQFVFPGGKMTMQATKPIKAGEEITVAYKEIAADVLGRDMVDYLHTELGFACQCDLCQDVAVADADNNAVRVVDFDVRSIWTAETNAAICADAEFASYVVNIIKNPDDRVAAASFFKLRTDYKRYFMAKLDTTPPLQPNPVYKHDLTIVLGELYCNITIHIPGQAAEDYRFWPAIYLNAIVGSAVPMLHAINVGYFARAYGLIRSMTRRLEEGEEDPCIACVGGKMFQMPSAHDAIEVEDMPNFVDAWVHIKMHNANLFGHVEQLALFRRAYPDVDDMCAQYHTILFKTETFARLPPEEQERYLQKQRDLAKLNNSEKQVPSSSE